jgi:hypothetical protein
MAGRIFLRVLVFCRSSRALAGNPQVQAAQGVTATIGPFRANAAAFGAIDLCGRKAMLVNGLRQKLSKKYQGQLTTVKNCAIMTGKAKE